MEAVQTKAARVFMGVHKFTATAAIRWDTPEMKNLQYWNRLVEMPPSRLAKASFEEEMRYDGHWAKKWRSIFEESENIQPYTEKRAGQIDLCRETLENKEKVKWKDVISNKPKLSLLNDMDLQLSPERYIVYGLSPSQRSMLAQLRSGTLPLAVETGRFSRTPREERFCSCNQSVETEIHFIFHCIFYNDIRVPFFDDISTQIPENISVNSDASYIELLCHDFPRKFSKFSQNCYHKRISSLFIN